MFGEKLLLKLFRRLDPGVNPDFEIGRFFDREDRIPQVPRTLAALDTTAPQRAHDAGPAPVLRAQPGPRLGVHPRRSRPLLRAGLERTASARAGSRRGPARCSSSAIRSRRRTSSKSSALRVPLGGRPRHPHRRDAPGPGQRADRARPSPPSRSAPRNSPRRWDAFARSRGDPLNCYARSTTRWANATESRYEFLPKGRRSSRARNSLSANAPLIKIQMPGSSPRRILWAENDFVILDFEGEPGRSMAKHRARILPCATSPGMFPFVRLRRFQLTVALHARSSKKSGSTRTFGIPISDLDLAWWRGYRRTLAPAAAPRTPPCTRTS